MKPLLLVSALLLATAGCRRSAGGPGAPAGPPWFEEAAAGLGLDFTHDAGAVSDAYPMPQIVGSGAALFDADGDGRLDLYLIHNGGPAGKTNRLFLQQPDGTFRDASAGSGLDVAGFGMGAAVGDVNNDGRPDVLLTEYGGVRLFLNQGQGKFRDVTRQAGLHNPLWATSASFLDYDRDGWLDLVVVNYLSYDPTWPCHDTNGRRDFCPPKSFKPTASKLFRNRGGVFEDVSLGSRLALKLGPGLGVVCADLTGDGWPDIFVANDGAANHLWVNQKDGTFAEEAARRGCAVNAMGKAEANMGVGYGDVDGDGLQDLYVTHLSIETNTVWKQGPPGEFTDWTASSNLHRPSWRSTGFGTVLADFDNDGALDAAVANGAVARRKPADASSPLGAFWSPYADRNQLFANTGAGVFRDLSPANPALCGHDTVARGLAVGDLRNDGRLWLVVTAVGEKVRLLRNVAPNRGHWLGVRVLVSGRDALGAEVAVRAGGRRWVRTAQAGGSYLCSSDPRAHFGVGACAVVDEIEVRWPDGAREVFAGGPADRYVTLVRGRGQARP